MRKLLLYGFMCLLLSSVAYAALTDDLVSYFPFDSNFTDVNGSGSHDLTPNGGAFIDNTNYFMGTGASSYDGADDYAASSSDMTELTGSNDRTICAMIKMSSSAVQSIVGMTEDSTASSRWQMAVLDSSTLIIPLNSGNTQFSAPGLTGDDWQFICVLLNGTSPVTDTFAYINGTKLSYISGSGTVNTASSPLVVGRKFDGTEYFHGLVDELTIWNRSLTESEIEYMNTSYFQGVNPIIPSDAAIESYVRASDEWTGSQINSFNVTLRLNLSGAGTEDFDTSLWDCENQQYGPVSHYAMNPAGIGIDQCYRHPGSVIGDASAVPGGKNSSGAYFDGDGDYIDTDADIDTSLSFSVSGWFNTFNNSGLKVIINGRQAGSAFTVELQGDPATLKFPSWNSDNVYTGLSASSTITKNVWYHFLVSFDSSTGNKTIYLNGLYESSQIVQDINEVGDITIAQKTGLYRDFNGTLDEVMIYNYTLTPDNVSKLYNYMVWKYNTTDGTAETGIYENTSALLSATFQVPDYFNDSHTDENITTLNGTLHQNEITFDAFEILSGLNITDPNANVTVNGTTYAISQQFNISEGVWNVTYGNATLYFNTSTMITLTTLEKGLYNITDIYSHIININATDEISGNIVQDLMSNYTNINYSAVLSANGTHFVEIKAIPGTYHINLSATNYAKNSTTVTVTGGQNVTNISFTLMRQYTVYFSIYNETTRELITQPTTLELYSQSFSQNYTTENGTINAVNLTQADYMVKYHTNGTDLRHYYFTLPVAGADIINLYLLDQSLAQQTPVLVTDKALIPLDNVTVKMMRAYTSGGSGTEYVTIEMTRTDSNGQGNLYLIPFDITYKFLVEDGSVVNFTSNEATVTGTSLEFNIETGTAVLYPFSTISTLSTSLTHDNTSNITTFAFNDASGVQRTYCLDIKRSLATGDLNVSEQCITAASGSIEFNYSTLSSDGNTYMETARTTIGSTPVTVNSERRSFVESYALFGVTGLLLTLMLLVSLTLWAVDSPYKQMVGASTALIISFIIGFINIAYGFIVFIVIGLIYMGTKWRSTS